MYSLGGFRPMALPNVPDPVNGMIRTYDNNRRTYSRPFSAKTVFFYKDGDEHFTGVRIPVSKNRYRTIDSLLDELNTSFYMPFGVRRLTTPMGRTNIEDLDQLQHMGKYVATSSKFPRGINLSALERFAKARQQAHARLSRETDGGKSYWVPTSPSFKTKMRMSRTLGLDFVPHKQIFFVLNGTTKHWRAVINPMRLPSMDKLMSDASEKLGIAIHRFFTIEGKRIHHANELLSIEPPKVLAVPRHAKPILQERTRFLPPINLGRQATFTKSSRISGKTNRTNVTSLPLTASTSSQKSEPENLMEKPRASIKKNIRKTTGAPKIRKKSEPVRVGRRIGPAAAAGAAAVAGAAAAAVLPKLKQQQRRSNDETDSGKATSAASSREKGPPIEEDEDSSDYPERRDDVTLTPDSRNAALIREEHEERHHHHQKEQDFILDDDTDIVLPRGGTANTELESVQSSSEEEQPDTEDEFANDGDNEESHNGIAHDHPEDDHHHQLEGDEEKAYSTAHHAAATVIQAHVRGHLVRKGHSHLDDSDEESYQSSSEEEQPDTDDDEVGIDAIPEEEEEEAKEMNNNLEHDDTYEISHTPRPINGPPTPPPPGTGSDDGDRYDSAHHRAAIVIQRHVRGHLVRINPEYKRATAFSKSEVNHQPNTPPPEEPHAAAATESEVIEREYSPNQSTQSEPIMSDAGMITYSITLLTGNRWGADSEVDMFVVIYGDQMMSEKIWLVENEMRTPKFRQNQLDTFHTTQPTMGTLQKIMLGHDTKGYGAGIFIDHVLITENTVDGKQFVFYISKWFDSGQVDGKLVRTCPLSAFYYISSIPGELTPTQGRWEFILHNGLPTGEGGTTSNLCVIGFGTKGISSSSIGNDASLQRVPSTSLIQIDFGDIGDLLKVRIEVDGQGEKPDYYLEYVEMRDLDTDERLAVRVSNWMDVTRTRTKKPQGFRELAVFRSGTGTFLQNHQYEGRVSLADTSMLSSRSFMAQLVGEYSDSGLFPLIAGKEDKKGQQDYSFKAECVFLGKIQSIKIFPDLSDAGRDVFHGLSVLQGLWEKLGLPEIPIGEGIIANTSWVRQSTHDPYRFTLSESHVHHLEEEERREEEGGLKMFKRMQYGSVKPLFTRSKKREEEDAVEADDWLLSMHVSGSPSPPHVILISESREFEMDFVETTENDPPGILHFGLKHSPSLGRVDKLRISCAPDVEDNQLLHIIRMRLVNRSNNEQLHYPAATTAPSPDAIIEFPAVYPDMEPKASLIYTVALETLGVSQDEFTAFVQVTGSDSNTGFRPLHGERWAEGERIEFRFEAIDVGTPSLLELRLEPISKDAAAVRWRGNAMVAASDSEQHYTIEGEMTVSAPSVAEKKTLHPH